MEQLIICPADDGRYAVRPASWAGIWDKSGLLASECKSIAYFDDERDAKDYVAYRALGPVEELAALFKARDEGRAVVLPCKPDEVYWEMLGDIPAVSRFDGICTIDENMNLFYQIEGDSVKAENIGKTVFLTREEAANALEENRCGE